MHTSVLLDEALDALEVESGGQYIDATAGTGGHLKKILDEGGRVLGIDWDRKQIEELLLRFEGNVRLSLVIGNFADIEEIAADTNFDPVDGILIDLGLSMEQIKGSGRGFSYKRGNEPLDMRINDRIENKASDLVNSLNPDELYEIFAKNSEELNSRAIAEAVYRARRLKKIETVGDLLRVIDDAAGKDNKIYARIFQALRMEVNDERLNLQRGLEGGFRVLKRGGRLVVITFHSVEDRIVKNFIKENMKKIGIYKLIKARKAAIYERSAKLRVIRKK